jgi:PTH1 family peptidyl-tRNA hydrolase
MIDRLRQVFTHSRRETEQVLSPGTPVFLIVGLGNPGREYRLTRHNIGFMCLDHLADRLDVSFTRVESRAFVAKANYESSRLVLVKPQTYMNLSGQAVSSLARFYKVPQENILVAYDDVDLPLGTLRLRPSGGSAGQKGMQSIIERLGSQEFPRLRIGIGRPPGRMDAASYVLQEFHPSDQELLSLTLERAVDAILTFVTDDLVTAMNRFNAAVDTDQY